MIPESAVFPKRPKQRLEVDAYIPATSIKLFVTPHQISVYLSIFCLVP